MPQFFSEGSRLVFRYDREQLWIEAWGADSLRVRATKLPEMPSGDWALLPHDGSATVRIGERSATIENGAIRAEVAVTGVTAGSKDFIDAMASRAPLVFAFVLSLAFILMLVTFRSIVVPIKAIVLNLLSVGAAYGPLVLVFQNSWAEGLLGFSSTGAITTWLPVFLFVVLFGLSMDYHIFVVSRIREGRLAGMSTPQAIEHGVTASAGVVSSAAFVMVAVFSIFALLSMIEFKQMGVGMAAAILIDATIVRAVILPSAMRLLGERNWWLPKPLRRMPSLGHG